MLRGILADQAVGQRQLGREGLTLSAKVFVEIRRKVRHIGQHMLRLGIAQDMPITRIGVMHDGILTILSIPRVGIGGTIGDHDRAPVLSEGRFPVLWPKSTAFIPLFLGLGS